MPLFHASKSDFVPGQIIEATAPLTFYVDAVAELENLRPTDAPSRSTCIFASDSADFAVFFLLQQQVEIADIRLYMVEFTTHWKAPFAITYALQQRIKKLQPTVGLVSEYWFPKEQWKFYEFFGPSMVIKEKMVVPQVNETILRFQYALDTDIAINI